MLWPWTAFHMVHSMICVAALYLTLLTLGGTVAAVVVSFVFQMTYLITGQCFWSVTGMSVSG